MKRYLKWICGSLSVALIAGTLALNYVGDPYRSWVYGEIERSVARRPVLSRCVSAEMKVAPQVELVNTTVICPQPVSLAHVNDNDWFVVNYGDLYLINVETGDVRIVDKPNGVPLWNPTGVFFDSGQQRLLIANYTGHDILDCQFEDGQLSLTRRITHPDLTSPENLCVSQGGRLIFVADYDGHRVFAFDSQTGDHVWSAEVPYCHAVCCDEESVYTSSLRWRRLLKYSYDGHLLAQTGTMGWGNNQYLWPTCMTIHDGKLVVSDAQTGRITFLDKDLHALSYFGGNGPGFRLFNMPYAVASRGDHLLVADTFKHRLVTVDTEGKILESLGVNQTQIDKPYTPLGEDYIRYVDTSGRFRLSFEPFQGRVWYTGFAGYGFNGLPSDSLFHRQWLALRRLEEGTLLFNGSCYFTFALERDIGGRRYLFLGSPQLHYVIVSEDGLWKVVKQQVWKEGNTLVDDFGRPSDLDAVVAEAEEAFTTHRIARYSAIQPDEVLRLVHDIYWPTLQWEGFMALVSATFESSAGREFFQAFQERRLDARSVDALYSFHAGSRRVDVQEILLARLLSYSLVSGSAR